MIPGRGSTDGKGVHIVQYYGLPEDFELSDVGNEAAVGLLQRLVHDGKEANGYFSLSHAYSFLKRLQLLHQTPAGPD